MGICTELTLRVPNSPGALAGICRSLADEHVKVLALALDGGTLRLVVDNHVRAEGVLADQHRRVERRDVLLVTASETAGSLAAALALVADAGVNVEYAYGATATGAPAGAVVLGLADAMKAAAASGL